MKIKQSTFFLKKLIFSYTLVFSILMAIIFSAATYSMIRYNDGQRTLNHRLLINQPLKELERILSIMDDTSFRVMGNTDIVNQFIQLQLDGKDGNYFEKDILTSVDIGSVLTNINSVNNYSWRVSIYNDKDDFISSGALTNRGQVQENLDQEEVHKLMELFKNSNIDFYIEKPSEDKWSDYFASEYFSIFRPIKNIYSKNDIVGIVEVQNNIDIIEETVSFSAETELYVNVYDENRNPIIIQNSTDTPVMEGVSEKYGWIVELVEGKSVRQLQIYKIFATMFTVWSLVTIIMYYIIVPILINITKPLTQLIKNISQLNATLTEEIPHIDTKIEEIILLEKAFNKVLKERTLSMEYEKTAYFMALQSQINPHFIYNILSIINAAAIEENFDEVMNICVDLSKMLRYSSSYDDGFLTLAEEIEHTKTYLKLMKARYDHLFDFTIEIDQNLLKRIVPKLIIQPICENSFKHAFDEIEPPYKIDVFISNTEYGYSIKVSDNGIGFTDNKREELLDKLNSDLDIDLSDKKIGGLGLVSTVDRLKLFTKQKVMCDIYKEDKKSVVEIMIFDNI